MKTTATKRQEKGKGVMKFFLDTANVDEIREAASMGVLDGVTTNPSLVAKEGRDFIETLKEITSIVDGPISAEVVSTTYDEMLREAEPLAKIHPNIVIKVPLIKDGLRACKTLREREVRQRASWRTRLMVAGGSDLHQPPFIGRDDAGQVGMEIIQQIRTIYDNYGFDTQILAASTAIRCTSSSAPWPTDVATVLGSRAADPPSLDRRRLANFLGLGRRRRPSRLP
jgi:transaldolase